jgi:hypothetical protein
MQALATNLDEKRRPLAAFAFVFPPPHDAVEGENKGKGIRQNRTGTRERTGMGIGKKKGKGIERTGKRFRGKEGKGIGKMDGKMIGQKNGDRDWRKGQE